MFPAFATNFVIMILAFTIVFFALGLIVGSFLNVVIFRLNTMRSLGGRSACMSCKNTLSWYELVPIFSFLGLMGRCRNCKTKISIQYPLVEIIAGLIYGLLFLKFQNVLFVSASDFAVTYIFYSIIFSILLVIAVYDIKHKIIPDQLSLLLGVVCFVGLFFFTDNNFSGFYPHWPTIFQFLSGAVIALPFYLFWLLSRGTWMGLGDAKIAIGLGWLLGISGVLSGAVVAFWSGAVIGILLLVFSKKHKIKSEIPFAPYLVLGAFLAFVFELRIFVF